MLKRLSVTMLAILLAGCATGYGSSGFTGGHEVVQLEGDIYRVTVGGNGYTTRETIETYWFHRASEFALEKGVTGFRLMNMRLIGQSKLTYEGDIRLISGDFPHTPPHYFDARTVNAGTAPHVVNGKRCDLFGNVCPHVKHYLQPGKPATPPQGVRSSSA